MERYTCEITGQEYTIHECKACDGSGLEDWHRGCGDSGPPTCRKCEGYGKFDRAVTTREILQAVDDPDTIASIAALLKR